MKRARILFALGLALPLPCLAGDPPRPEEKKREEEMLRMVDRMTTSEMMRAMTIGQAKALHSEYIRKHMRTILEEIRNARLGDLARQVDLPGMMDRTTRRSGIRAYESWLLEALRPTVDATGSAPALTANGEGLAGRPMLYFAFPRDPANPNGRRYEAQIVRVTENLMRINENLQVALTLQDGADALRYYNDAIALVEETVSGTDLSEITARLWSSGQPNPPSPRGVTAESILEQLRLLRIRAGLEKAAIEEKLAQQRAGASGPSAPRQGAAPVEVPRTR